MTHIHRSAMVPYSASAMYDLVLDVSSYPEFLPWCGGASVQSQSEDCQIASVSIAKGPINTAFTTRNTLMPNREIKVNLVKGPFKSLSGTWRFDSTSDTACRIELDMHFEFSAGPLGMVLKPVFTAICDSLLNAFVQRAEKLHYGKISHN